MALDSLGLGLTLDTTLLEKADKTLENMQRNSQLIMQNLNKGFSAFNRGDITDFSKPFDAIKKAMDTIKNSKVSIEFDTNGLERGLDLISQITLSIEKMAAAGTKQFFDPTNIYTTSKSMKEATDEVSRLKNELDAVHKAMHDMVGTQEELNALIAKMAEIKLHNPSTFTENQEFMDALARVDEINKAKAAAEAKYGDMEGARMAERQLIESIEIAKKELEWTKMTKAQQMAAVVSYNQKIIADEKKRASEVESLYKNNFAKINELFKNIEQLERDRAQIEAVGGDTSEYDKNLTFLRDELDRRMKLEEEIVKSDYPKIAKIKQEMETEEFIKASKERARLAEQEQRRDVSYANKVSKNASSVEEEAEAVRLLAEARDKLSYSTAHYDQIVAALNKRIAKHEDQIKLLTHEQKESNTLMDSVISRYIREKKEIRELNKLLKELHEKQASTGVKTAEEDKYEQDIIARRQRLWNDVNQIETDNAKHIAQLREKFDASVAEEKVKEILKTNEREKQEYEKLLDDLYAIEKQKKAMEEVGGGAGDAAYDNLLQQEADLNARKSQLEATHQNDLDEIRKKHAKKRSDDEVKAFIAAEKEKQRIAEETAKKMREKARKYGTISSASADRLIGVTDNAKNINQHKAAIKKLEQARASLDNTDKNYYLTLKKIEKALQRHHKELRLAGVESNNLMQSHRGLLNIGGQLARRLAFVFSVSQLTQYFRKLVEVRGQFEKTEVALTSIIGDNQKADKLMNQTIALAIKSPFTLQQLTAYTKQLAAYQVSYEELHSTTKMLADVSAGLGVEMDRLILAFGQVKAANYLRATEVRQFTEAGFNILGELADYYNELEGTMLSVGDVQEMITKRMVGFADVEAVFHRVTEAGGMFYEMQSKQAETLAGQWTNLQDRIDVMFNEIGTSSEEMLKGFVSLLASAIDNWEAIGQVIKTVVTAFVLYKLNLLAVNKAQIQNALATQAQRKEYIALIKRQIQMVGLNKVLGKSFKNLWGIMGKGVGVIKKFLTANKWVLILTAVAAAITSVVRQYRRMQEALWEQDKAFNANASSLQKLAKEYEKITKEGGEFEKKLAKLEELSSMLDDRNLRLSVKIEDVDESNIDEIFKKDSERLQKANEFGKSLGRAITRGANEAQGNILGWSLFGENLAEDAEDYGQAMAKLISWGMKAQMQSIEDAARVNYKNMGKYAQEYFDSIKDGQRENESDYEWTKRRAEALVMISTLEKDIVGKNKELGNALKWVTKTTIELRHESKGIFDNLADEAGGFDNLRRKVRENPIEMDAQITTEVDKLDYDPATKEFLINDLRARLWITPYYVEDPNAEEAKKLARFQQDLVDARANLEKKGKGYQNFFISKEEIEQMKFFSDGLEGIQKLYDENKKTIEQLEGTQEEYNEEEIARLNALQNELRNVAKLWGYNLDKGNESSSDKILQRRINLLKEVNKKYLELEKTFDAATAKEKVMEAYSDTFREAFAGTGVDLDLYKVMTQVITDSKKVGEDMGSALSEGVINKLKELEESGTYIRSYSQKFVDLLKSDLKEGFRQNAYWLNGEYWDKEQKIKKYTYGYGFTTKEDDSRVIAGDTISREEADRVLEIKLTKDYVKELNRVLDLNKDLILTQEQYDALLDATYQGWLTGVKVVINGAKDIEKGVAHIVKQRERVEAVMGKEAAARFGDEFVNRFRVAENIYERMAMLLETINITKGGGKVIATDYNAMQKRSDQRAAQFRGDLDIANQLESVLVRIAGMDFTTTEGMVEALGKLKEIAEKEGPEAKNILSQAISGLEAEIGLRVKKEADKELNDEVQALFDRYELTVDLKKLNLPKGAAEQLFDTQYLDLEGLRKAVTERADEFVGTEQAEQYKKFLEKIDEMERKDLVERTKKYLEYAKMTIGERAKIKIEELTKLKEIEDTFEIKSGDDEETVAYKKDMRLRASLKAREEAQKALQSLEWDEFQKTDTFTSLFDDIDNASDALVTHMITKLRDFKEEWKDMPLEDVKTIVGKLNELESTLAERSPWEAYRNARDAVKNARENAKYSFKSEDARNLYGEGKSDKDFIAALQIENAYQEEKVAKIKEEMAVVEEMISLKEGTLPYEINVLDYSRQQMQYAAMTKKQLRDLLKDKKKEVEVANAIVLDNGQILVQYKNQEKSLKKQAEVLGEVQKMANNLYDAFTELAEALGADSDSPAAIFADMGMSMANTVLDTIMLIVQMNAATIAAKGLGAAMKSASGIIGWIVMAIELLVQAITAAVNYAEKMRQMKLDILADQVDNLKQKYDALAESIDKAYSTKQLQEYSKEIETVQAKMEDAQRDYIKLLESGKDGDTIDIAKEAQRKLDEGLSVDDLSKKERKALLSEEYQDYKEATDALAEMQKDHEEQKQDLLDSMGGVTDYKSAAQEFVDAWVDAFQETGDGLSGLQENFREFFDNVIKREAMRRVTDKYMQPFFDDLNAALESDSSLSEGEIADLKAKADKVAPELSKVLEELWTALGGSGGKSGVGLTELQKGISSISEETAQVLEAYLNSVRMYVATISADTTSQLNEVKAIHRLLDSVTRGGHPMGGSGFKVFMN